MMENQVGLDAASLRQRDLEWPAMQVLAWQAVLWPGKVWLSGLGFGVWHGGLPSMS